MKKNIITAILGVIITATSIFLYTQYRVEKNKKDRLEQAQTIHGKIRNIVKKIQNADNGEEQIKIISETLSREPQVSAIITTGKGGLLKRIGRGKNFRESENAIEFIVETMEKTASQDLKQEGATLLDGRPLKQSYYLFPHSDERGSLAILISPAMLKSTKAEMVLEVILLISLILTCTSLIYLILRQRERSGKEARRNEITIDLTMGKTASRLKGKKGRDTGDGNKEEPPAKNLNNDTEVKDEENPTESEKIEKSDLIFVKSLDNDVVKNDLEAKNPEKRKETEESFNNRVMELFREIKSELPAESIMLYIKKMENRLNKTYELRGKTFLKIDSSIIDSIDISELKEAHKSGAIITQNGQKIQLPIVQENSLLGIVEIFLNESILNVNLENLKEKLKDFARATGDYLTANRIIFDEATGLYSDIYFKMKIDEMNYKKSKDGYAIITMDLFKDKEISPEEKNLVIKIIQKDLYRATGITGIYKRGEKISAIQEYADKKKLEELGLKLTKEAKKFRIKLSEKIVHLNPAIEIITHESSQDESDHSAEAHENH